MTTRHLSEQRNNKSFAPLCFRLADCHAVTLSRNSVLALGCFGATAGRQGSGVEDFQLPIGPLPASKQCTNGVGQAYVAGF
jgi:hypothetical protein